MEKRGGLGTDQRRAGILPATICRQDGGAPDLARPTRLAPMPTACFSSVYYSVTLRDKESAVRFSRHPVRIEYPGGDLPSELESLTRRRASP